MFDKNRYVNLGCIIRRILFGKGWFVRNMTLNNSYMQIRTRARVHTVTHMRARACAHTRTYWLQIETLMLNELITVD